MRLRAFASVLVLAACDRGGHAPTPPPAPPASPAPIEPATSGEPSCTLAAVPARFPAPARLVAIGDLHGDLAATRSALRAAGAIDARDAWIGGTLWIVQTGDILDRGDDEQAIVDLFGKLETEARAAGGAVIVLDGNHELMNAAGDFRYVTPGGMRDWDDVPNLDTSHLDPRVPATARARVAALMPGGPYAKRFAQHNVIAIVGDTVFSHAGVLGDWVTHVDDSNRAARCFLDGQAHAPPAAATAEDGPLWTRAVGGPDPDCAAVKAAPVTAVSFEVLESVPGQGAQRHFFDHKEEEVEAWNAIV